MSINGVREFGEIIPHSIVDVDKRTKTDNDFIPFADYLRAAVSDTNKLILESENISSKFASGMTDNIHQVLIAAEKADIALQLTIQVRNKILDAYNEIMRMQI